MERDNAALGRTPDDPAYEDPDAADAIFVPGYALLDATESNLDHILAHRQVAFTRTWTV